MYPDPLFTLLGKEVNLYGILIALGIIICIVVFFVYAKKSKMHSSVIDFIFYIAIFAIAFGFGIAALAQACVNFISSGVFSFTGITVMWGLIGGAGGFLLVYFVLGKYIFKNEKKDLHKREFNKIFCIAPCCITIAHSFGRVGCLMAGCCHGVESHHGFTIYNAGAERIPVQLYEAICLLLLFAVLSVLFFKRCNYIMHIYLVVYGICRFTLEFFRGDIIRGGWWGLANSQWVSILFVLGAVALTIFYIIKKIPFFNKN